MVRILKTDVSHRFLPKKVGALDLAPIYEYTQGDGALYMKRVDLRALKENIGLVLDVINLKWILILEQYNNSPRIGKKVKHMDNGVSVDHVIPWSFMYSDDLWNLVFVHRACNSRKSNTIPSEAEIAALKERNGRLLELVKLHAVFGRTKLCFELEDARIHDLARRFWIQCQG